MKKYLFVFALFVAAFGLTSCSSDDDNEEVKPSFTVSKVQGKWFCLYGTDLIDKRNTETQFLGESVVINADGTYTSSSFSFGLSGSYVIKGNRLIFTTSNGGEFTIKVYFEGENMIWSGTGEGVKFNYIFVREKAYNKYKTAHYGTWVCQGSIEQVDDETYLERFVGVEVELNIDGTYTSTSEDLGLSGTYKIEGNKMIVESDSGEIYRMTYYFDNIIMMWLGETSSGKLFEYHFVDKATWLKNPNN